MKLLNKIKNKKTCFHVTLIVLYKYNNRGKGLKKMKMKKKLCFLLVIVMSFILVGCDLSVSKITVKYDTVGGNEIADTIINFSELDQFELPENPAKDGFVFDGWYLDETYENPFEAINIEKGTITLYAKWKEIKDEKKGFAVKTNFQLDYDNNLQVGENKSNSKTALDVTLDFLVEDTTVTEVADYKAQLDLEVQIQNELNDQKYDEHVEMSLYLFGNKVYVDASKMLEDPSNGKVMIDLQTVVNKLLEKQAQLEQDLKDLGIEIDSNNETLPEEYEQLVTQIQEAFTDSGLTEEDLNKLLDVFKKLTPSINQTLDGIVYEFKQEHLEQFLDAVKSFADEKFVEIYTFVNSVIAIVQGDEVVIPSEEEIAMIKENIMAIVDMVVTEVKAMVKINEAKLILKYNPDTLLDWRLDDINAFKEIQGVLDLEQENPVYESVDGELFEGKNTIKVIVKFSINLEKTDTKVNEDYSSFTIDSTSLLTDNIDYLYEQLLEQIKSELPDVE